tara:strand:- start:551 stop:919 length:369 start_codon:yes stop_codon:yes gene_type:complete
MGANDSAGIVRDPADVQREQAAAQPNRATELAERVREQARDIAAQLTMMGAHNQQVSHNSEFCARIDVGTIYERKLVTELVEALLREELGEGVTLFVRLYDTSNIYDSGTADITIWASPKKP